MSISPTDAQRSTTSESLVISKNPSFDHGVLQPSELIQTPISVSTDTAVPGTVPVFASESTIYFDNEVCGPLDAAAAHSGGFSKKVIDTRKSNGKKNYSQQKNGTSSHSQLTGQRGIFSKLTNDQGEYAKPDQPFSQAVSAAHDQSTIGSVNFHASATHSAARRNHAMNGNHLLNFHYDRVSQPRQKIHPLRRQQKLKPYNKDLFLQANFKFVVLDSGNFATESMVPDKMLQWEDVICVRYSTPHPVQCPICLELPLCPQITSCGHIFCFPCILRYLFMGDEDHKGNSWKKCPLCFMMISSKDLYTVYIENVKQYHVGDRIEFSLLTRPKDSLTPIQKNQQGTNDLLCKGDELYTSFSKFTLTLDVELSVREAKLELESWLARAESGVVDDLEKLPYVCAAIEQLDLRKKYWTVDRACSSSPPIRNTAMLSSNVKPCKYSSSHTKPCIVYSDDIQRSCASPCVLDFKDEFKWLDGSNTEEIDGDSCLFQSSCMSQSCESQERISSSSYEEKKSTHRVFHGCNDDFKDGKDKDSYTFYQASDGQHLILHPLTMKCLLHYYGSYDVLPQRISGKILQLETLTQSETTRRRYRFLSHFSLTTSFQLCELDARDILPPDALSPFIDEIKKREKQRERVVKKELKDKVKAEAAAAHDVFVPSKFEQSYDNAVFSMDDFEALGSPTVTPSAPVGERKLFSNVTRLGFAAGHDSPSLKIEESPDGLSNVEVTSDASGLTDQRNTATSFANIISRNKSAESPEVNKVNGLLKKGKKSNRVLLSTAGSRRY